MKVKTICSDYDRTVTPNDTTHILINTIIQSTPEFRRDIKRKLWRDSGLEYEGKIASLFE